MSKLTEYIASDESMVNLNLVKKLLLFVILFLMGNQFVEATEPPQKTVLDRKECHLKVGWGDWPPFQTLVNQKPQGIQIDLINQIANEAGCSLSFELNSFSQNLNKVKEGKVDLIFDTTVTEKRELYSLFSDAYRKEVMALYVRPKFLELCDQNSVKELILKGMRLGVTKDNLYGNSISAIQGNPMLNEKLVYRQLNIEHLDLFKQDKIDALIEDPLVMAYSVRHDSEIGQLEACKIAVSSSPVSLMFSRKTVSKQIVERFNKAIQTVKATEHYQRAWQ